MKTLLIALVACSLSLIGCGDKGSANQTRSVTIYGEPADQFFSQFMYQRTGNCAVEFRYRYLMGNDIPLQDSLDGGKVNGFFRVFLYANHRFIVDFEAQKNSRNQYNGTQYSVAQYKRIEGTWHIDGNGDLVLPDVGIGQGRMANGEKGVLLHIDSNFTGRLSQKRTVTLAMRASNVGPTPDCAPPEDEQASQVTYEPLGEASQTSRPSLPML